MTEKEIVKAQGNNIQATIRIDALFEKIAILIEQSRQFVANTVNVAEVRTRYEVDRYIYEDEQQGERASYGKQVLKNLSARLMNRYGEDWTYDTLKRCRFFYQAYANAKIGATPLPQLEDYSNPTENEQVTNWSNTVAPIQLPRFVLSWSHYLVLMRIENIEARYYDRYVKQDFVKPTIGILLCPKKNDALVEFTLPKDANIYAQQYAFCLPNKEELKKKLSEWVTEFEEINGSKEENK